MHDNRMEIEREFDYTANRRDPYREMKISLICSCRASVDKLKSTIESFANTCSNVDQVELVLKFDSDMNLESHKEVLLDCPFRFKMVVYPRFHGYWDQHMFANDLVKVARGDLIWHIGDDLRILSGDWFKFFMSTRDNYFKDNIYVVNVGERPRREKSNPFTLLTKEWISFFGVWAFSSNSDYYLNRVARGIGRYVEPNFPIFMEHDGPSGYMRDDTKSTLDQKRKHTNKLIKRAIKGFNKRKKK